MVKKLMVFALVIVLATPAISAAMDKTGALGLGFYDWKAPIGIRYWFSPTAGFDLGLGFDTWQEQDQSTGAAAGDLATMLDFRVDAGLVYVAIPTPNTNFLVRPGVLFESSQDAWIAGEKKSSTSIDITLHLGVEHFFNDRFSLSAGHGIRVNLYNPAGDEVSTDADTKSKTTFHSDGMSIVDLGFHFYFK